MEQYLRNSTLYTVMKNGIKYLHFSHCNQLQNVGLNSSL